MLRYSESKISRGSNKKLRQRLKTAYGGTEKPGKQLQYVARVEFATIVDVRCRPAHLLFLAAGLQRCSLTGAYLPSRTVIAAHLYKHEWRDLAETDIGLRDIDDPGNGLLLWKPIEHAFHTSALSFIYEKDTDRYIAGTCGERLCFQCHCHCPCLPVKPEA